MNPVVSVIIPVYNAEDFIKETVQSVLKQTWRDLQIIAVNDGSKDRSLEVLHSITDDRLIIINIDNAGASNAKQVGLQHAKGDYIQYLDADDILAFNKIELQVEALKARPGKVALCNTAHFFSGDDYLVNNIPENDAFFNQYLDSPPKFLINLYGGYNIHGGMVQPNAFLIPREIIRKAGPWNGLISPCQDEDGEYFCRVILASEGIIYNPSTLNFYRKFKVARSLSAIRTKQNYANLIDILILKYNHILKHLHLKNDIYSLEWSIYKSLREITIQAFPQFPSVSLAAYKLSQKFYKSTYPKLQIKLGGSVINAISKSTHWTVGRILQFLKKGNEV